MSTFWRMLHVLESNSPRFKAMEAAIRPSTAPWAHFNMAVGKLRPALLLEVSGLPHQQFWKMYFPFKASGPKCVNLVVTRSGQRTHYPCVFKCHELSRHSQEVLNAARGEEVFLHTVTKVDNYSNRRRVFGGSELYSAETPTIYSIALPELQNPTPAILAEMQFFLRQEVRSQYWGMRELVSSIPPELLP